MCEKSVVERSLSSKVERSRKARERLLGNNLDEDGGTANLKFDKVRRQ
jgi:hypothetical protein